MQIIDVNSKFKWEKILSSFDKVSFLQSFRWGQFQKQLGNQVIRLQVITDTKNFGAVQYYIVKSKLVTFLYCPRGPLATSAKAAKKLLQVLIEKARKEDVAFLQVEPDDLTSPFVPLMKKEGFICRAPIQPAFSLLIALKLPLEEIYKNFRKTTRAEIRKATEEKVTIKSYNDLSKWDDVKKLFLETSARQKFISHPLFYIKTQFENFAPFTKLYIAQTKSQILSVAIILSYRKVSAYLHAASSIQGRNLGVSHLMVKTAIEDAKKSGDQLFDLWGVAPPPNRLNHPWAGITIFKQGFGGQLVSYPEARILPLQKIPYTFYQIIQNLRALPVFKMIQRILLESKRIG